MFKNKFEFSKTGCKGENFLSYAQTFSQKSALLCTPNRVLCNKLGLFSPLFRGVRTTRKIGQGAGKIEQPECPFKIRPLPPNFFTV